MELARRIPRVYHKNKRAWSEQLMRPNKDVFWSLSPSIWIKLNFDATIREEKTTIAFVSRDSMGNTLQAWFDQFIPSSPLVGEARATWNAIKLLASKGYKNIILEGDAWNFIEPFRNADVYPHWSNKILCDDMVFCKAFYPCKIFLCL